jgi:crotonobetainyl-CoA:carnitine CoA-transferase CaiB-like acyl-CoA transferase
MAALNHRVTGEPRFVPMVVADKVVGLIAVQMIAMALYRRTQSARMRDRDSDVRKPGQVRARRTCI